jgi:hypothetical protein
MSPRHKKNKDSVPLYENDAEKNLHINAMHLLALNTEISIDEVKTLYEIVLKRLKKDSKIREFLPLLASKRVEYLLNVREMLREKSKRCKPS